MSDDNSGSGAVKCTAPFPWFGGKTRVAAIVWQRFGDVPNYVEPFFGSGAVMLNRPTEPHVETINDIDGYVANFWRAVQRDPDAVAEYADWPVNENDLHARHVWLRQFREELPRRLEGDPTWYDAQIAGWWVWGVACWIGGGFCGPGSAGPWQVVDGKLVNVNNGSRGVKRQRVHLGDTGQGVQRKRVHLGDPGRGVKRQLVHLGTTGQGVQRKLVRLLHDDEAHSCHDCGSGRCGLYAWFRALQRRLKRVRVCCGDFERTLGSPPTVNVGLTAVFLDPPYGADADRDMDLYGHESGTVAGRAREWAIANGDNPRLRIALCGYDGEHSMPDSWECVAWQAHGGYGNQGRKDNPNKRRERIWFSPHCLKPDNQHDTLFEARALEAV